MDLLEIDTMDELKTSHRGWVEESIESHNHLRESKWTESIAVGSKFFVEDTKEIGLDFEIDELTNSVKNTISGDSFQTEVSLLTKSDLKTITKSRGWLFNWRHEFNQPNREVYKLTIIDNPDIVQGLISFTVKTDHVYMFLLETALCEFFNIWLSNFKDIESYLSI